MRGSSSADWTFPGRINYQYERLVDVLVSSCLAYLRAYVWGGTDGPQMRRRPLQSVGVHHRKITESGVSRAPVFPLPESRGERSTCNQTRSEPPATRTPSTNPNPQPNPRLAQFHLRRTTAGGYRDPIFSPFNRGFFPLFGFIWHTRDTPWNGGYGSFCFDACLDEIAFRVGVWGCGWLVIEWMGVG